MAFSVTSFGTTQNGETVSRCTLSGPDCSISVLTWGATLQSVVVPGNNGPVDVLVGCDTIADYEKQTCYLGSFVGRVANRISSGGFTMGGTRYNLFKNDGPNTLHGGRIGYDKRVFEIREITDTQLCLALVSPDGEEGFPGRVDLEVVYSLVPGGFRLEWTARSDAPTPFAPTCHAYWNLSGSGDIHDQQVQLFADGYTPIDNTMAPLGQVLPVENTPFDFRAAKPIGLEIDADDEQLALAGGYDHNFALIGETDTLRPCARAFSPKTGIRLSMDTTLPGVQFYTGNFLNVEKAKGGVSLDRRTGYALEPQYFPDFVNHPNFPAGFLIPSEEQYHCTQWTFDRV